MNHKQPTKEELKAAEDAAIAEAEKLEKEAEKAPEEVEEKKEEVVEPTEDVSEEPTEESETHPEKEEDAEPSKEIYKKKFSASSRENQRINAKNRIINQAIIDAETIPEPTEEEMQGIYKDDWDVMSEIDKDLAKETIISKKWRAKIKDASDQATKVEKWSESVDTFADDPKTLIDNPELEGKTDEFKVFAIEEANNNVPFNI